MSSVAKSLVASLVSDLQVPSDKASEIVTLQDLVLYLTDEANASLQLERKVTPAATVEVANRAIAASARRPMEVQIFNAVRAVRSFLTLAASGVETNLDVNVYDLLPIGHPLSQAVSARSNENILKQRAAWVASGSDISDEARPLVASAFLAPQGSIEQRYAFALLAALPAGQVPAELLDVSAADALTAGLGDGNSRAARSWRARRQRRDRKGRFAWMGGRGSLKLNVPTAGGGREIIDVADGQFVGGADDGKLRILVRGNKRVKDGVYLVDSKNFELNETEGVIAELTPQQLKEANISLEEGAKSVGDWANDAIPNIEDVDVLDINSLDLELADKGLDDAEIAKIPSYRAGSPVAKLPAGAEAAPDFKLDEAFEDKFKSGSFAERFGLAEDFKLQPMDAFIAKSFAKTKEGDAVPAKFKKYAKSEQPLTSALDAFDSGELNQKDMVAYLNQIGFGIENDKQLPPLLGEKVKQMRAKFESPNFNKEDYSPESKAKKAEVIAELPESAPEPEAATPAEAPKPKPVPKPSAPKKTYNGPRFSDWKVPEDATKLNTGEKYVSDGMIEDITGGVATDDPAKLANLFTKDELEEALSNSVVDGFADMTFKGSDEPQMIPGEAIYDALREQGNDPDLTLAQAYDFLAGGAENFNEVADFKAKASAPKGEVPTIETIDETVPRPTKERVLSWQSYATKSHDLVDDYRKNGFEGDEAFQQIADVISNQSNVNYSSLLSQFGDWANSDDPNKRAAFQGLTGVMNLSDADGMGFYKNLETAVGTEDGDVLAKYTYENLINSKFSIAKGTEDPNSQDSAAGNMYRMMATLTQGKKDFGPLYRGQILTDQVGLVEAYTTEGNIISFDQRPFSYDSKIAAGFAERDTNNIKKDADSVLFSIENNQAIHGLDTKNTSTFNHEQEVLVADKFKVVGVETKVVTLPNGKVRREHNVKLAVVPETATTQEVADGGAFADSVGDPAQTYDLSDFNQISGPQGSNQGGVYENSKGEQIYVKEPKSQLHGENEVLASALYEAAGVNTAQIRKGKLADGKEVTFSPMIDSTKDFAQKVNDPEYRKKVQDGFAVDAWLANWDVAGTGFDNIVTDKNGEPVRVDPGGALLFRAQGALKGKAFGDEVAELDSLTDPKLNSYSAKTFGDMTDEDKAASVEKLLTAFEDESTVNNLVDSIITDQGKRDELKQRLAARKEYLKNKYQPEGVEDGGAGEGQPAGEAGPEGQGTVPEAVGPRGGGADGLGDSVGDSPWSSLGEALPQSDRVKALAEKGLKTPAVYELDPVKDAAAFRKMMEGLKEGNPYAASVYIYDEDEYKQMRLFATADGKAGFALKNGNEIVSVYAYQDSDQKGSARSLIAHGIDQGGDRLDAFDTVLPKLYAKDGFRPISRVKWNDDFAPEGWDYDTYKNFNGGRPDVVAMAYDPTILGEGDGTYDPTAGEYFDDYDAALAARDKWIADNQPAPVNAFDEPTPIDGTTPEEMQQQLEEAIAANKVVSFTYNDKPRVLRPLSIWTNPKNQNVNLYAVDNEGNKKYFTISKIQQPEPSPMDSEPTEADLPELTGYEIKKTSGGINYAPDITADDIYALRNGQKKPPQLPFVATNDPANGNAIFFDTDGTKRWGQFGAAGAVLRRQKADGTQEILLVKRSDATSTDQGVWSVPSGAHDTFDASMSNGVTSKKEVAEELGIALNGGFSSPLETNVSPNWNFTYDTIDVDPAADFDGMVAPNKEIAEYKWVTTQELKEMQTAGELHPAMVDEIVDELSQSIDNEPVGSVATMAKATEGEINAAGRDFQLYPSAVSSAGVFRSTSYPDGAMSFGFGKLDGVSHTQDATMTPNVDGSFDVYFNSNTDGVVKAVLPTSDAAKAWIGEQIGAKYGLNNNAVTNKPLGEETAAPIGAAHKGGYVKPATQPQIDAIKKMLGTKEVPDDKKAEIEAALGKKDLVLGEAGQYIGYLKGLPNLPVEEVETSKKPVDPTINPDVVEASLKDPELTPQKGSALASADDVLDPAKILEALKLSHKDSYELDNGDVALYSTTYTTGYGKSYKYELIARRTKKERFFAYVRETNMQTGDVRVFKATKEVHSYKAAMNKLQSAKNGLTSSDPRNWFTKLSKTSVETVQAKHDLTNLVDGMLGSTNGAELQSNLEDLIAGLGGQSFSLDKKIIEKLQKNSANLPAGFVDNVINKMVEGKAKEADNISDQILGIADPPPFPHMSYNGTQLQVGDFVDWTDVKTGKVHRGKVVHLHYNHDSKGYVYSDQTLVEFDDLNNQRWRVSSNLVKVDKNAPLSEPFFAKLEENVEQKLTPVLSTTTKPDIDKAKQIAVENYKAALEAAKLLPNQPDIDLTPAQEAGLAVEMTTPDVDVTPQTNGSVIIGDEASGTYTLVQPDGTKTYYLNGTPVAESAPKTADSETVSAVADVVSEVTSSPDNTVDPAQLGDVLDAAQKAASVLPEPTKDPVYGDYNVKMLGPDDVVTTGGKKAKFKYFKEVSELQVGDIVRQATGDKKYFVQILEIKGRNKYVVRDITPTTTTYFWTNKWHPHGKIEDNLSLGYWSKKHVYRPTEAAIADGYFKPKTDKAPSAAQAELGKKNLNVSASNQELVAKAVNKKSEESNKYFGITGEIGGLPYNELAVSTSDVNLWKEGFDSIKVKTGDNKYVIPGALISANGDGGIVVATNKPDSELSVLWTSGPKQSTLETLASKEVNDTGYWVSPENAKSLGIFVDEIAIQFGKDSIAQKIKSLEASNAAFLESKKKEIEYKKLKEQASVKGTGAEAVKVSKELSWSDSDFNNVNSLESTLNVVAANDAKGASGEEVLIDSGDIEDSRVRVYTVYDTAGKKETRLTFTLTSWATDSGLIDQLANNSEVSKSSKLQYRKFQRLQNKLVENGIWDSAIDQYNMGTTYSMPLKDANGNAIGTVRIHRANKDGSTPKFLGKSDAPIAYHNKVDISIDGDATPEQVQLALQQAGVNDARPATKEDIKILAENKIIGIFGQKADGSINFEGELRTKILEDVKAQFGITGDDLEVVQDANGEIQFLLPEEFGKKMAEITNTKIFSHNWNSGLPGGAQQKADFLFGLLSDDGLRATTYRWASGINTSGMSSSADGYRVGANYVFTRKGSGTPSHNSSDLSFHFDAAKMLRRLDFYANTSDNFGAKSEKDMLAEVGHGYVYEILFKGTISWADLAVLSIDSKTRELLLERLLNQGTTHFGDRPVQDVLGVTK